MKWKTKFTNKIGDEEYPIYLIKTKLYGYDLECRHEIPAMAWFSVYEESIKEYEKELEMKEND